jgi:hypothetical protein
MRFFPQMLQCAAELTAEGSIVLAPFVVTSNSDDGGAELKRMLDELHLRKIDMSAHVVVVTNQHCYIGDSTMREIEYATGAGKFVSYERFHVEDVTS